MLTTIIINAVCVFVAASTGAYAGCRFWLAREHRKAAGKLYVVPRTPPAPIDPGGRAA